MTALINNGDAGQGTTAGTVAFKSMMAVIVFVDG
jgi:hypothetical protein